MKIILIFLIIFTGNLSIAQSWQSQVVGNSSNENEGVSIKLHNNKQYITGVFENQINIGFNSAAGLLYNDIFLAKADLNGYTEWLISLKGTGIDRPNHIEVIDDLIFMIL